MKLPSRTFWIVILSVAVAAVLVVVLTPCNAIKQSMNIGKARDHIQSLGPDFLRDPRFVAVDIAEYTGSACGCIRVSGWVPTDDDVEALRQKVAATNPSVEVTWSINPAYETWPQIWESNVPDERKAWFPPPEGVPPAK